MIPETIILVLTTVYIASALDFTKRIPVRISAQKLDTISAYCYIGAGLSMLAALITDTVLVFSKLQNYESGEFFIHGLSDVNWLAVGIVSVVAIVISTVLVLVTRRRAAK
jgi:multisubunit Na+/H+ antiporter MnhB subunit